MTQKCPLCSTIGSTLYKTQKQHFYLCKNCKGIFLDKKFHLNKNEEKVRYYLHQNHINDHGYIKFADPIISFVRDLFNSTHQGLDFGAGHTPVISEVLKRDGFQVDIFDPLFFNDTKVFNKKYDFITCCEVIEHFYNPKKEFELLHKMLKPNGKLICMTHIFNGIDFASWYYKTDPTHVFLYQEETLKWIKINLGFQDIIINNRLIIFTK
ncbi:MAG: class I SAM-dependent methyltransferase [Bacteroidota bacterium]